MPDNKLSGRFNDGEILMAFVDKMITDKNGESLDRTKRMKLRATLFSRLQKRMRQATLESLSDAKIVELESILNRDGSEEELAEFFKGVENLDGRPATDRAMKRFRDEYLAASDEAVEAMVAAEMTVPEGAISAEERNEKAAKENGGETEMVETDESEKSEQVAAEDKGADGAVRPPEGAPVQGLVSEVPGQSDVEGRYNG